MMRAKGEVRQLFAEVLQGQFYSSDYDEDARVAAAKALGVIARSELAHRKFAIDMLFNIIDDGDQDIDLVIVCIEVLAGLWDIIPDSEVESQAPTDAVSA
jgi:hypothetical protein